eukprot:14865322-Alexandrium_andersonii.AAC.2
MLRWSILAMASGVWPSTGHTNEPFPPEAARSEKVGKRMRARGVILHVKGDWAEFCGRFGLPAHGSALRPCFCCAASGPDEFYNPTG